MVQKLDSVISLSPGFKTAVNLAFDLEDDQKVSNYLPTEIASDVLLDMGENLHPLSGRRSRLLTGTYGTGKSHLALVLARLYRDGVGHTAVTPILEKLQKWPGKRQKLMEERGQLHGPFLLVLLEGDYADSFNDVLLQKLDEALDRIGLRDLFPETAFDAAIARIKEIQDHQVSGLDEACKSFGFPSAEALEESLRSKSRTAFDKFRNIHKELFAGAPFFHHHMMEPKDVYAAVARKLIDDHGYNGIVVIWDEFGRYMERIADNPRGKEGQFIQTFADGCCNKSGKHQIHLYLLCHRSLDEYARISAIARATGTTKEEQAEWTRISGRFREFKMRSTDQEVFDLIDQIIIQQSDTLSAFEDFFAEWTDQASRMQLFPEMVREQIHSVVTVGAYPLHPMAAFCLPQISQKVAQNERTLFTFLSDSGTDTLGPFLHETEFHTSGVPTFFPADRLWDFFGPDVEKQPLYRRVYAKFSQANVAIEPDDELAKRIIKTIALLQVIGSDRAPCTESMIAFSLGLRKAEHPMLREKLKSLCSKEGDRERILIQSLKDNSFRFSGIASEQNFEEKIERVIEERTKAMIPAEHLRGIMNRLDIPVSIRATSYSEDFMLPRALRVELVEQAELKAKSRWLQNLGAGDFVDGYALIVLCENGEEIRRTTELVHSELKHPQMLIGVPKDPVHVAVLARKHDALDFLEKTQGNLYGLGADLRESWEEREEDLIYAIRNRIEPLLNPEKGLMDWFVNGERCSNVRSESQLREVASTMMRTVFSRTPKIAHERLTAEDGKDTFSGARREIINKVLQREGPTLLAKETSSRDKTVIDLVYRRNGILRSENGVYVLAEPDSAKHPEMNAVWKICERAIDSARQDPLRMIDLVTELRKPPFGIRLRSLSLIVAAAWREYILRGNLSLLWQKSKNTALRVTKLDGPAIDEAIWQADSYRLAFSQIGDKQEAILLGLAQVFGVPYDSDTDTGDLVMAICESVAKWWRGLSPYSQSTRDINKMTLWAREAVFRSLSTPDADAHKILVEDLPLKLSPVEGKDVIAKEAVAEMFTSFRKEIEAATEESLLPKVKAVIGEVFQGNARLEEGALAEWFKGLVPNPR